MRWGKKGREGREGREHVEETEGDRGRSFLDLTPDAGVEQRQES